MNKPNRPGGFRELKTTRVMEHIWIITNSKGEFIKACANRENAKTEMENWRNGFEKAGIFESVSKLDAVYCDHITFDVTHRDGTIHRMTAREQLVY